MHPTLSQGFGKMRNSLTKGGGRGGTCTQPSPMFPLGLFAPIYRFQNNNALPLFPTLFGIPLTNTLFKT